MALILKDGWEYARWEVTATPAGTTLVVEFNRDGVWRTLTKIDKTLMIAVVHPQFVPSGAADEAPPDGIVLNVGRNYARFKPTTGEMPFRDGGHVHVHPYPAGA